MTPRPATVDNPPEKRANERVPGAHVQACTFKRDADQPWMFDRDKDAGNDRDGRVKKKRRPSRSLKSRKAPNVEMTGWIFRMTFTTVGFPYFNASVKKTVPIAEPANPEKSR
jgi:hypothetical protein